MFDYMDFGMDAGEESGASFPVGNGPYIPEAQDCMRCGMCVTGCPTYRLMQTDAETPRQRIRSIEKCCATKRSAPTNAPIWITACNAGPAKPCVRVG